MGRGSDYPTVEEGALSLSGEEYDLLSDQTVRFTLTRLLHDPASSLDELATAVAGMKAGTEESVATKDDYRRIKLVLYHSVLPRLEEHGYLTFEYQEQSICDVSIPNDVENMLRKLHEGR